MFKRRVVAETLEPGASVAAVARQHGLNANMVFLWRSDPRFGPGRDAPATARQIRTAIYHPMADPIRKGLERPSLTHFGLF